MVIAVILAAGAGRRMGGRPKALLVLDDETFLERVARTCREGGARRLVVVTRTDPPEISRLARSLGATVVENPDPERGMFSSVRLGIEAALAGGDPGERPGGAAAGPSAEPEGVLVFPVDHPRVAPATVAALIRALPAKPPRTWLRPVHAGRGGHPVLVDRATAAALLDRDPSDPLREALRAIGRVPHPVPVDDAGVGANLNRPDDLS